MTSGGGVDVSAWLERVPALIQAWFPGEEGGAALAELLFGDANPSGRLPATFERRFEDNPVHDSYYPEPGSNRIVYKEGALVGYRGYEKSGIKPMFPFGYGLSYTTFAYANLAVKPLTDKAAGPAGMRFEVSFEMTNTGRREGADVAQVYVADAHAKVPRPPKELKGFVKRLLRPGETKRASVILDGRAFSYYNVAAGRWRVDPGDFEILVARSSDEIVLSGRVTLSAAAVAE